jgi:hypothetical protein
MASWKQIIRTLIAAAALAAAGSALAAPTPQELRAYQLRGEALNRQYGNEWTRLSVAEYRKLVGIYGVDAMTNHTPQELEALLVRGQALNKLYAAPPVANIAGSTFDWTDAGIGFATAFGIVLLAAGAAVIVRRRATTAQPGF